MSGPDCRLQILTEKPNDPFLVGGGDRHVAFLKTGQNAPECFRATPVARVVRNASNLPAPRRDDSVNQFDVPIARNRVPVGRFVRDNHVEPWQHRDVRADAPIPV